MLLSQPVPIICINAGRTREEKPNVYKNLLGIYTICTKRSTARWPPVLVRASLVPNGLLPISPPTFSFYMGFPTVLIQPSIHSKPTLKTYPAQSTMVLTPFFVYFFGEEKSPPTCELGETQVSSAWWVSFSVQAACH